jgi:TonB family protein
MPTSDDPRSGANESATHEAKRTVWAIHIKWHGKAWVIGMDRSDRAPLENAILAKGGSHWRFFGAGAIIQALLICFLIMIPLLFPDRIVQLRRYIAMEVAPTSPVVSAEQPLRPRRPRRARVLTAEPPDPPEDRPQIPSPVQSVPTLRPAVATNVPPAPEVAVDSASANVITASTIPHLQRPQEPVRVGGFGDPAGFRGVNTAIQPNVPHIGSFDRPSGPAGSSIRERQGTVREGVFGSERAIATSPTMNRPLQVSARSKPVKILFKPTPEYTRVAVAKKIQGDVLLEILFSASGEVKVLRVIKGLGYGLDETAIAAAQEIRFRPARNEDGQPIDSTARVRIAFELAF